MKYPGGKNHGSSYPRIINQIPPHHLYVEPFAGSAAIRRMMRPSARSILIDLDAGALAKLAEEVPPGTELLCCNALDWLDRDPLNLAMSSVPMVIYCDPPYVASACASRLRYEHVLADEDHHRLLCRLKQLRCFVLISGYWSDLYAAELRDWRVVNWPQMTRGGTWAEEFLWCNYPEPVELHDYAHLGSDFRERQDIRRQQQRWRRRLAAMTRLKRLALMSVLSDLQPGPLGETAPDLLRGRPVRGPGNLGKAADADRLGISAEAAVDRPAAGLPIAPG